MKKPIILLILAAMFAMAIPKTGFSGNERPYDIRLDNFFGSPLTVTGSEYLIRGRMAYIGSGTLQSVYLHYQINGGETQTTFFDNIGLNPQIPFFYIADQPWIPTETGSYELSIWFSGLNGAPEGEPASVTLVINVDVYDYLPEREFALLESFSSINCGSCVFVSNMLKNLVNQNPDKYAMIYYHPMQFENSPLYNFNPKDQNIRRNFYEVFYTPFAAVGSLFQGNGEAVNQNLMDIAYEMPAGFEINGSWYIEGNTLYAEASTESFANFPDHDLRLQIVLVEDSVSFDTPPGSNGEKDFYYVMRTFLPDANGTQLNNQNVGSTFSLDVAYQIPTEQIDTTIIRMYAFIQDMNNMDVHQFVRLNYQETEEPLYTVTFNVSDNNGDSIDNAVITFGEITNSPGDYVFEEVTAGSHQWSISCVCYNVLEGETSLRQEDIYIDAELSLNHVPGDANGDGIINVLDVIMIANYYIGLEPPIFCFYNADVNGDGAVNSLDIIATITIFSSEL